MSTDNETYNGWTNRETWALMLHVNNDEGLYEEFREVARNAKAQGETVYAPDAVQGLWEQYFTRAGYEDEVGDNWPDSLADIAADIGSLWRVNWDEVTAALLED